ncbi:MAG: protein-tyrosine phosphatase family protein [Oscillochloridaceae bacterium umkhey_bin13]
MQSYLQAQWRRFFGLNVSPVDQLLFVGGQFRPEQWPHLYAMDIRAVLSLQAEHEDQFIDPLPTRTLRLLVEDHTAPTLAQLAEAVDFMTVAHNEGLPVFVHCHAGVGRAPTTAAAYVAVRQGLTAEAAMARIAKARPIITPNPAQMRRLHEFVAAYAPPISAPNQ